MTKDDDPTLDGDLQELKNHINCIVNRQAREWGVYVQILEDIEAGTLQPPEVAERLARAAAIENKAEAAAEVLKFFGPPEEFLEGVATGTPPDPTVLSKGEVIGSVVKSAAASLESWLADPKTLDKVTRAFNGSDLKPLRDYCTALANVHDMANQGYASLFSQLLRIEHELGGPNPRAHERTRESKRIRAEARALIDRLMKRQRAIRRAEPKRKRRA